MSHSPEEINRRYRDKLLRLIIKYMYDCKLKAEGHTLAEGVNRKRERISSWTQSILSLVVGITGVSAWNQTDECGNSSNLPLIATGVTLSFLSAGIGATRNAWKFATKEALHHAAASNYSDVASDIEFFLTSTMDDVEEVRAFADMIHEKMDIHGDSEPPLSDKIVETAKTKVPLPAKDYNPVGPVKKLRLDDSSESDQKYDIV